MQNARFLLYNHICSMLCYTQNLKESRKVAKKLLRVKKMFKIEPRIRCRASTVCQDSSMTKIED